MVNLETDNNLPANDLLAREYLCLKRAVRFLTPRTLLPSSLSQSSSGGAYSRETTSWPRNRPTQMATSPPFPKNLRLVIGWSSRRRGKSCRSAVISWNLRSSVDRNGSAQASSAYKIYDMSVYESGLKHTISEISERTSMRRSMINRGSKEHFARA